MSAGLRGLLALQGVLPLQRTKPPAGVVSWLQLSGVWVTSAGESTPPVTDIVFEGGPSGRTYIDDGYHEEEELMIILSAISRVLR